ncbi:MAG: S8 family serine peptidase [Gallionella sp.]|nr:S8 family serine peptidase [Gallionella sp.]
MARDGNNLISWTEVSGASSYNVYWSTASGVNRTNTTKITRANTPQAHTGLSNGTTYYYVVTALNAGGESAESAQASATPVAAAVSADPLYAEQWHLKNTGQTGATGVPGASGEDINVEPVWQDATPRTGNGIRIAIVDDGLEIGHEDLAANIAATGLSYNYVTGSADPGYDPSDTRSGHGTAVAGIAAARDLNGLGVRGVAPRANLVGYNLLQYSTTSNEADAMTRGSPNVHIYNNSWGSDDDGDLHESASLWRDAIDAGLANGRNGHGSIYVWAAGNGGDVSPADNSNYDGMTNYYGVIAVAAVDDRGRQSSYSEPGANIWISAPGGEFCGTHAITTTDRTGAAGDNPPDPFWSYSDYVNSDYTKCMNGTSAAVPAVSGAIALILEANPNLGWRDVRLILAQSARNNDATDMGWGATGGLPVYHFNHKYGFGVIDAQAAVALAQSWSNVGPQLTHETAIASPNQAIPNHNATGVSDTLSIVNSGITNIEYVEITFSAADHTYAGDLAITLTSPAGTVSQLSETHACQSAQCTAYSGWVFGSARHLGEAANGNWTLSVKDGAARDTGTFQSWKLKFYGR